MSSLFPLPPPLTAFSLAIGPTVINIHDPTNICNCLGLKVEEVNIAKSIALDVEQSVRITVKKLFKSFLSFKSQNQYLLSAAGQAGAAAGASRRGLSRAARSGDTKGGGEGNSCGVHF